MSEGRIVQFIPPLDVDEDGDCDSHTRTVARHNDKMYHHGTKQLPIDQTTDQGTS